LPPCNFNDIQDLAGTCNISSAPSPLFWQPWHVGTEVFFDQNSTFYQLCTQNFGEDPMCSDQFDVLSTADHNIYLNIDVECSPPNWKRKIYKFTFVKTR